MPTGTVIAGYTIERKLGAGGMGTVYLARHPSLPRSDALKVLSAEFSADPQFRARFRREADLAAGLDHPNVVRVYTRGETDDGRLWMAMQYVEGTDAGAVLDAGPMDPARAVHIVAEVAKALDYAHSRKLLHRDIKPANFLLAGPAGPAERVLLADFGIARAADDATRLTATGSMVATVAYASPEAVEGRPLDHRSDLYSLGCALFRMLTDRTPFQGVGPMSAVMMAHVMRPPPRVSEVAPWVPPGFDAVIATAMAKDPAARYQSARDLALAAQTALAGGQPAPPPPPPDTPAAAYGEPAPSWMTDATQTYPSGYYSGPHTHPGPPHGRPRRRRRGLWLTAGALALVAVVVSAVLLIPRGEDRTPYPAQMFAHTFGATRLDQRPTAVAALGPGDADTALSLGVQPVALLAPGGTVPGWLRTLFDDEPTLLATADPTAIAAAHADLIIDTGIGLDRQLYDRLAAVAPTITRPNTSGLPFTPQLQLSWLGGILGEGTRAAEVARELGAEQSALRAENPEFADKTVTAFYFTSSGLSAALAESPAGAYLTSLGFTYNSKLPGRPDGAPEIPLHPDALFGYPSDVAVIVRTDPAAGNGAFGGLPDTFSAYGGAQLVVDEPDVVAALAGAGPAATRYLNDTLVPQLQDRLG
ncbi:serine/threonine-protein kinase [Mycolicibacterium chitae]|uniref:non-specific serine/threonine protein kinase n=1 Tax=Mycolicibacterium chitae TaxID=1792 RepID=A0A448I5W2_MYCCI|nr:serine/threonine-protein kinase [Mycolicibacterium chitae]MCV7104961.1 protein kinase [Mycolicibacterium chitae]VEG47921.1 transmembrane serine/threonine-protein kinase PknQ [Mycolicibacterium chitae]